jgi:signal peptidase I
VVATLVVTAVVAGACVVFAPQTVRMEGQSMAPALRDDDRAVAWRPLRPVARGDIVTYRYPRNPAKLFAGRVVGLPGERVGIVRGVVVVDGRPLDEPYLAGVARSHEDIGEVRLGDEYYILGDNRGNSSDSREWGPVARDFVRKRVGYVWWRSRATRPASASDTPAR